MKLNETEILAYLDGNLDERRARDIDAARKRDQELDSQIRAMEIDVPALKDSFDELLEDAPQYKLTTVSPVLADQPHARAFWRPAAMAAGIVLAFAAGFASSHLSFEKTAAKAGWLEAVAEYQSLYSQETLLLIEISEDSQQREIEKISQKLGLSIKPDQLNITGLELRQARLLKFKNKPLAQFAFLDSNNNPIAFCIIRRGPRPAYGIKPKQLKAGLNAAEWSMGEYGFVVVGRNTQSDITALARRFMARTSRI